MDSIELKTIKEKAYKLEIALKDNYKPVIYELRTQGLIKDGTFDRVMDNKLQLTEAERAAELVRSIEDTVKLSSDNYSKLVEILSRRGSAYKDIVLELQGTYCGKLHEY